MINGKYILVIAPKDFPGKRYRGRYCYEHILSYWKAYNVLPKENEIVHHIDGNTHNNVYTNLELKDRSTHSVDHGKIKLKTFLRLKCPGCGKIFIREKKNSYISKHTNVSCCSRKCIGIYTGLDRNEQEKRKEVLFIEEFKTK